MIVCRECGHENGNNDTFCQNPDCHAFLEWVGESTPTGLDRKVLPADDPGGAVADGDDSTPFYASAEEHKGDQAVAKSDDAQSERPVARPEQHQPVAAPTRPAARPPVAPRTPAPPAGQPPAPPAGQPPAPPAGQPPAQEPAGPQRQAAAEPQRQAAAGPQRQVAAGQARPSGPVFKPGNLAAISRPPDQGERGRTLRRLAVVLVVFVVLAAGMIAGARLLRPDRGGGTAATTTGSGRAKTFAEVRGVEVKASSESGSRKAALLVDGKPGTYWSRLPTDQFATLSFSFAEPVRLGRIAIAAGASGGEFKLRHRPKTVELAFSDGTTLTKTLADQPEFQNIDFPPRPVERVTIKITEVFRAPRTGQNYRRTSIAEVRFYGAT